MSKAIKYSPNDVVWQKIFQEYRILEVIASERRFVISADEINKFGRQARLMTKFDHRSQLPELFEKYNLSILPTARGTYEIGTFETFFDVNEEDVGVTFIEFPSFLESLDYKDITSEATAINCAFVSEILHDFIGEEHLFPTVSGRMSSSKFDFSINSHGDCLRVNVNNSQIEIDGGYEGDNSLTLIEAKNYISDDFLIRQLYYPYRLWLDKVSKHVRSVFLTYSNGIFHIREYQFVDVESYNSIQLVRYKKYAVQERAINIESIQNILESVQIVDEPELPFPQADSFERVINLCELLKQREFLSKEEITQNYDFEHRQTDYYSNAAKYLGLIDNMRSHNQTGCVLSKLGCQVFSLPIVERQLAFVKLVLSHRVFNSTLKLYFEKSDKPSKEEVVEIMKRSNLYGIDKESTYERRSSSIISWTNWIIGLIEE